jgi:Zn-dependent protease/predicted transcriptional regulator
MVAAMLNSTFRLFTIRGIEVGVHYSWLIIFALVSFSLSVYIFPSVPGIPRLADLEFWVLGILTALLLFVSVLVHELAHSFVALARGLKARSITLFIFGGVSNLSGDSKDSATEFLVAIVGPLTSFALAAISFGLASVIDEPRASLVFSYLFFINLTLGIFNLVPGFPLDGGRVLRAILWRVTGNVRRATVWAANVGRLVALVMFGYAIYLLAIENSVLGAVWTAAIAWFLYSAAAGSVRQIDLEQRLRRVRVGDVITRDEATVTTDISVADLVDRYLLPAARIAVPVEQDGRLIGVVAIRDIAKVPPEQRAQVTVGQVMGGHDRLHPVTVDTTVIEALELMDDNELDQLPVLDGEQVVGLITRADVARQLQLREDLDM